MAVLFWDASALAKRYFPEVSSDTVDALFACWPAHTFVATSWGYAETYSILFRRLNGGFLDPAGFTGMVTLLQADVVDSLDFDLLPIGDETIFACIATMQRHNLNSTDAAILTLLLSSVIPSTSSTCVLVASDHRLLRAAQAEGLQTINPQTMPAADVPAFLATL